MPRTTHVEPLRLADPASRCRTAWSLIWTIWKLRSMLPTLLSTAHRAVPHRPGEPPAAHRRVRLVQPAGELTEIPGAIGPQRRLQLSRVSCRWLSQPYLYSKAAERPPDPSAHDFPPGIYRGPLDSSNCMYGPRPVHTYVGFTHILLLPARVSSDEGLEWF